MKTRAFGYKTTSCWDKVPLPTYLIAIEALKNTARKTGGKLGVYRCGAGPHYHVGHLQFKDQHRVSIQSKEQLLQKQFEED